MFLPIFCLHSKITKGSKHIFTLHIFVERCFRFLQFVEAAVLGKVTIRKRCLLWDYHNTTQVPQAMDKVNFDVPISFVSNWNSWVPPELKGRAPYRPMIREEPCLSGQDWDNVENTDQPIIHFFNEPERHNISAEQAADVWQQQMLLL